MSELGDEQRETVLAKAARLGVPERIQGPGRRVSVLYDFRGDQPLYRVTFNAAAAVSTAANLLRDQGVPYGLDGTGMKAGVWDEGRVRNTHREFSTSRVVLKDGATVFSDHATHVAGTIGAAGTDSRAKGMAPSTAIDSYDWNNDYTEMTAAGAAAATDLTRLTVSNHSYGIGFETAAEYVPYMGAYEEEARTTDAVASALPYYQPFWAAGNERDFITSKGGYQSITFNGLAKNVITIAAAGDAVANGVRNPVSGPLAYFSSLGPCDDGRIKPDLTANGVDLFSPVAFTPPAGTSSSTAAYDTYSGTSMATPNAVGSAVLLQQLYTREFPGRRLRASTLKALLINTADDVGRAGPDYEYGWGYLNAKAAADLILAHKASLASPKLIEGTLTSTEKSRTHTFAWDGVSPIRATLCWTDPAGAALDPSIPGQIDVRTPRLVNNLDLKLTAPNGTTVVLPYVMPFVGVWTDAAMQLPATTGVNQVDNVEQVHLRTPSQAGNYTLTVSVAGSLAGAGQVYSLALLGAAGVAANPAPVVTLDTPADGTIILASVPVILAATAVDQVAGGGPGVVGSVAFLNGTTVLGTSASAPHRLSWTPPGAGVYELAARATDSEGASSTSAIATLTVLSGNGAPSLTDLAPSSGTAGDGVVLTGANFAAVSAVRFNGVDALFTVLSPTSLAATVPATATTGKVTVVTPRGVATSAANFTIVQNPVLVSQIYGAGGNSGAVYNSDYIELHNRGAETVSLGGWSVQYASASGGTWQTAALSGSIAAGKYYLVKLASASTGAVLPAADATGSFNMSGSSGKVALRNTTAAFTGSSPAGQGGLLDLVGYGSANAFEGSAAPSPSSTTAIFRAGGGAVDTANNADDFIAAAPLPRNSSAGQPAAPVISGSLTASGTVGEGFVYQIVASNAPTVFAATGLPAGLAVNSATGRIAGTPVAPGISNVTLTAGNATGSDSETLTLTINAAGGGADGYLVDFEDGSKSGYASENVSLNGLSWNMTEALVAFGDTNDFRNGARSARLRGYATSSMTMRADKAAGIGTIEFQHRRYGTDTQVEWIVDYSVDAGSSWREAGRFTAGAAAATFSAVINQPAAGRVRIRTATTNTSSNRRLNIDDLRLTDAPAVPPAIFTNGTPAAVNTTYGAASPVPASFTVSGENLAGPILVAPPSGYEVSQSAGGAGGYAVSQSVGAAGAVQPTTLYLRLAAGVPVGAYSGNVVCSSPGAVPVNLATAASLVVAKDLVVTAQDRTKPFGATLLLGGSAFTADGLVPGETVGAVTLTATGGTAANDAAGTYLITPSAASGGAFSPGNYVVSYRTGTLTVTAPAFADWAAGLSNPAATADPDADGLPNLLEYFLGLNAAVSDAGAPQVSVVGSELRIEYRRSKALSGVSGVVEWTTNLAGTPVWSAAGITDTLVSDQGVHELRRAAVTWTEGEPLKFLRLRVSLP